MLYTISHPQERQFLTTNLKIILYINEVAQGRRWRPQESLENISFFMNPSSSHPLILRILSSVYTHALRAFGRRYAPPIYRDTMSSIIICVEATHDDFQYGVWGIKILRMIRIIDSNYFHQALRMCDIHNYNVNVRYHN